MYAIRSYYEKLFVMAEPHLKKEHDGYPGILNMFYVGRESIMLFGAMATDWDRAADLLSYNFV